MKRKLEALGWMLAYGAGIGALWYSALVLGVPADPVERPVHVVYGKVH